MAYNTKIPLFRRWVLQNFPFIEQDFDALTDYQLICKVVEYLNKVIEAVNADGEQIELLTNTVNQFVDYINHYFDNLDVQNEIDKKLDQMASTGELSDIVGEYIHNDIQPQIDSQNIRIGEIADQVDAVASYAPTPVSSISQMTDQNKIYVLTTDGKWYYYNTSSSNWVAGGTYQAVSLGLGSVDFDNLTNNLAQSVYGFCTNPELLGIIQQNTNNTSYNFTRPMLIKAGTTITVSNDFVSNYHWNIRTVDQNRMMLSDPLFSENTNTSYTFTNDTYCVFSWRPIDNDWNTADYTVNRRHRLTASDITSILFFYEKTEDNKLIDLDVNLFYSGIFCATVQAKSRFAYEITRASNPAIFKSKHDITVELNKSGYQYGLITWDMTGDDWHGLTDTGWTTDPHTIPANTYFSLAYRRDDNHDLSADEDVKHVLNLYSYGDMKYIRDYVDSYEQGTSTYNYEGENLDLKFKHGYEVNDLFNTTLLTSSSQGFDIYGGYLVQLYNGGLLNILNMSTGVEVSSISGIGFEHGDTLQFSNTFYDAGDAFPLAYVTSDTTPGKLYVVRINTLYTASIVKTYQFPQEDGYYAGYAVDFDNNIAYSLAYKANSFRSATDNATIISVYNLDNVTDLGQDVYSPELIERYEKPFIYCMQGMKMLNGVIYIVSSYDSSEQNTRVYVYDPIRKLFPAVFTDFPNSIAINETEDIAFIKGTYNYDMVIGTRQKYMKLSFSS